MPRLEAPTTLSIVCEQKVKDKLEQMAKGRRQSLTEFVRELLTFCVEAKEEDYLAGLTVEEVTKLFNTKCTLEEHLKIVVNKALYTR